MPVTAVIPARFASTRFPGKPLARDTGKYLIQHVCERVGQCDTVDRVVVATDDGRIEEAVKSFGGEVLMTRADHVSGTDRVGEVVDALGLGDDDVALNVQGDEPEVSPADLSRLITTLTGDDACTIATLATPFPDDGPRDGPGSPLDPNCVKVVMDDAGRALYFSRSLIPFPRASSGAVSRPSQHMLHLGVYAFSVRTLRQITADAGAKRGRLEEAESLEQLRWLEGGLAIKVAIADHRVVGIDTPEDYAAFVKRMAIGGKGVAVET